MYAELNSPLPGLTVSPDGCHACGMRGYLGQDDGSIDTTPVDVTPIDITVPYTISPPPDMTLDPENTDIQAVTPNLSTSGPATIGTEFVAVGGGNYLNTQTGQTVPQSIAEEVTAATAGTATQNLQTVNTPGNLTLIDPASGQATTISTNNLTSAAQVLQAAGQLVDATGKLTAQGQALLNGGNLYNALPQTGASASVSAALASVSSWFGGSTIIPGIPNAVILVLGGLAIAAAMPLLDREPPPKRRRR